MGVMRFIISKYLVVQFYSIFSNLVCKCRCRDSIELQKAKERGYELGSYSSFGLDFIGWEGDSQK